MLLASLYQILLIVDDQASIVIIHEVPLLPTPSMTI